MPEQSPEIDPAIEMPEYVPTFDADWTIAESEAGIAGSILGQWLHPRHIQSSLPSLQTKTRVNLRVCSLEREELELA